MRTDGGYLSMDQRDDHEPSPQAGGPVRRQLPPLPGRELPGGGRVGVDGAIPGLAKPAGGQGSFWVRVVFVRVVLSPLGTFSRPSVRLNWMKHDSHRRPPGAIHRRVHPQGMSESQSVQWWSRMIPVHSDDSESRGSCLYIRSMRRF